MTVRPFVLCLLSSVLFTAHLRAAPDAPDDKMRQCAAQLTTIHNALAAYEKDHGRLPDQLSDLLPKYLPDPNLLHCPADPAPEGTPGRGFAHRDPKLPASYTYEFSADESHGLPTPLGKNPTPDIGKSWGTCRLVMTWQSTFFGDQVPVVRCSHHKEEMSDDIALGGTPRGNERTVFSDYGVSAYPTHFLIDHDGKVVWHSRGYEESAIEELRKDLEKLGMK